MLSLCVCVCVVGVCVCVCGVGVCVCFAGVCVCVFSGCVSVCVCGRCVGVEFEVWLILSGCLGISVLRDRWDWITVWYVYLMCGVCHIV